MSADGAGAAGAPDWQPTLEGRLVRLRPLRPDDLEPLFAAAADPLIWAQHSERERHTRPVFERFFQGALDSGGGLVALDAASARVIGTTRFYDWNPRARSVVLGYTFLVRDLWGGPVNREMKRMLVDHALRWADSVWFHVSPGNMRSRRALEKLGARLDRQEDVMVAGVMSPRLHYVLTTVPPA